MQVKLVKLHERLTPEGFFFDEEGTRQAIAKTQFPVFSKFYPDPAHQDPFSGVTDNSHPDDWEFKCNSMDVVDGYLVGEVEFITNLNRALTHTEKYVFFARVMPIGGERQMSISGSTFRDYYFSSVAHRAIA